MDSDSEDQPVSVSGIPATIILINIFDPNSRKSSEQAHVATCQLVRHYLPTQSSQYLSVSLYGTDDDDDTSIFALKCVKNIFPLTSPTLDEYKKLESINVKSIKQSKELVLSEDLAHCSKKFSACKKTLSTRTIVMLSPLDQPPAAYDQKPTLESVADLFASGIQLKLINIANSDYKINEFYEELLFEANKDKDIALPDCVWDTEEITKQLITQSHRHLAISELPFEVCKDVTMGVKIYKLLKSQIQPKTIYLHKETNASITSSTKTMKFTKETDMDVDQEQEIKQVPLLKSEVLQCQEYGGEIVEFTDSEMKMIKNPFGPNILKLLGFKPAHVLQKEKWFIENCYFLFPSEEKIEGSTIAFKALYQACIDMNVVAICILRARVNSKPRLVALSPCTRPFGLNVDVGFDVIIIPFAENVRNLPHNDDNDEDIVISNEQRTIMNDIINAFTFDYKPEMFENPMLQSKYRILEAKALDYKYPAEMQDTTKPNDKIFEHLDDEKFYEIFGSFGAKVDHLVGKKRADKSKICSTSQKKAKMDNIDQDLLRENIANKKIDKEYTVPQLKQILRSLNVTVLTKRKDDLVKLVYEHYA